MATLNKTAENTWRAQVRLAGHPPKSKTFKTRTEAVSWARLTEAQVTGDGLAIAKLTILADALDQYQRDPIRDGKRGVIEEDYRIGLWRRDPLAQRSMLSIRSVDIAHWRDKQLAAGAAPTTIKNKLTIISQVYHLAAKEWGMDGLVNPVRGVRMPRGRPGRDRRLAHGEEDRLLATCATLGAPWLTPLVILAIETGMRRGELLSLTRDSIRGNVAWLPRTKNGRSRSVPLSTRALAALADVTCHNSNNSRGLQAQLRGCRHKEWHKSARSIFPHRNTMCYYWRRARGLAGMDDLRFHDLRHEATSRLFERGLNHFEVMAITGHTTTIMLQRYTHFDAMTLAAKLG